jgi:hypothetical protein
MFSLNCQVTVLSFNGTFSTPEECSTGENYWLLIGKSGEIIETINERGRVLVKFGISLTDLGLHGHNPMPNSLYLLTTDLQKAESKSS